MINSHAQPHQAYDEFSLVLDPDVYEPLPDDWLIGITDVVSSTAAIRSGRYEDVNYAGASVIAALGNAWGSFDFPFVFRGDGAAFASRGEINFGLHRQSHALMTCLVPSDRPDSHLHFLDGMGGGYARAAEMMEAGALDDVQHHAR
ncbi:DUF3095 family protein [Rhizobium leguminosarum]|uniref:DUF3095 family protein n=1 Tax=Rhizobium leguminosarum TaxID=384 RepID=UPI001C96C505|nr:DUF3095 family protein [Rhizobium leguminosarum]MBY5462369.1 DUF3095 domain-containing protein [Rhizobium leguminosarum]